MEPDGRGAPEVSLDGRIWRCGAGTPGDRGRFRQRNSPLVLFRDAGQGYSAPESTPAGHLSGEYQLRPVGVCRERHGRSLCASFATAWRSCEPSSHCLRLWRPWLPICAVCRAGRAGKSTPRFAAADTNVQVHLILGEILGYVEDIEEELDPDDPPVRTEQDAPDRDSRAIVLAVFGREPSSRSFGAHRATGPPATLI